MIKLLTVDDEIDLCEHIKDIFSRLGYEVFIALNGKDALSIVKKEKPKIVFLDVIMPAMDGLEVLRQIKEFAPSIKVIMLSVADDPDTKNKAKLLGADCFLRKPFLEEGLENEVIKRVSQMAKDTESPRMLIVDDEQETSAALKEFLVRRFECEVSVANNGEDGLKLLKEGKFDLLLLDIRMPGISGMDILKEKNKLGYKLRIWVITGFDSEEVAHKVIEEGADDYIPKPVSLRLLGRKVRDFLAEIGKYKPIGNVDFGK